MSGGAIGLTSSVLESMGRTPSPKAPAENVSFRTAAMFLSFALVTSANLAPALARGLDINLQISVIALSVVSVSFFRPSKATGFLDCFDFCGVHSVFI